MRRTLPLVLLVTLIGCKGSREKDVVGTWTTSGMSMTAAEGKTFKSTIGPMTMEGTWTVEGDDATFQPKTLNGQPIAALKAKLTKSGTAIPAQAKAFVDDMDKPNVMTLSADGKSMTTDKAKDKNSDSPITMTKS